MGLGRVVLDRQSLDAGVRRLAAEISRDYAGNRPLFIGILKGSIFFLADLTRNLAFPAEIEVLRASSYGASTTSSGELKITSDVPCDVRGRDLVLVEDIVDTGLTLRRIVQEFRDRDAASVRVCALVRKRTDRNADVVVDYLGFEIEDVFVVGYGLDAGEQFRNLPDIHEFSPEETP